MILGLSLVVMNKNFKANERELVKVASFFKRQSRKLIGEGKLGEEHKNVEDAVDRFIEHMERHADLRADLQEQREYLTNLVKDSPVCPRCHTSDKLKLAGTEKNDKGWKSNRYRCRKCNIAFTWDKPNNPWDMIKYIEEMMGTFKMKLDDPATTDEDKAMFAAGLENMQVNLDRLKPVIDAHDREYEALQTRDIEMEKLIHEFKNSLLIEKIKMDTWENKNR